MVIRVPTIDAVTGPFDTCVTCIYGPAGSGKTTLALQIAAAALTAGEPVVFIDCQSGLSMERLMDFVSDRSLLKQFLVRKVYNFQEQDSMIGKLPDIQQDFGLVIADSIGGFYRVGGIDEAPRKQLELQMRVLVEIGRKVPVVLTNQVYDDLKEKRQKMIAEEVVGFWAGKKIQLSVKPHRMIVEDGEGRRECIYEIAGEGIQVKK